MKEKTGSAKREKRSEVRYERAHLVFIIDETIGLGGISSRHCKVRIQVLGFGTPIENHAAVSRIEDGRHGDISQHGAGGGNVTILDKHRVKTLVAQHAGVGANGQLL
jgi:hypothetical protein